MIFCRVCDKEFYQITNSHLKNHGMTIIEYCDSFGEMQSLELKKKRSRLHTKEEKRKISEGNRGQISKLRDRTYEEIHGKEKGNLLRLDRSLKAKGRENKNKGKTYEEIYGDRAEEEKKKRGNDREKGRFRKRTLNRKKVLKQTESKSKECPVCNKMIRSRGHVLHEKLHREKPFTKICRNCYQILDDYHRFCSVSCSTLFACKNPDHIVRMSKAKRDSIIKNPETHPNYITAGMGRSSNNVSRPQKELFISVTNHFPHFCVKMNHYVKTDCTVRYIDVAIPELSLGFEFDGKYWHKKRKHIDEARDAELTSCGWNMFHFCVLEGIDEELIKIRGCNLYSCII